MEAENILKPTSNNTKLIPVKDFAASNKISVQAVYQGIKRGKYQSVKFGTYTLVKV